MSSERIVAVKSKLDAFELGKKTPSGTPTSIGMNKKTGDIVVEMEIEPHPPEIPDVMRYVIIPRDEITRIDGERIDGPTLVTPTGLEV